MIGQDGKCVKCYGSGWKYRDDGGGGAASPCECRPALGPYWLARAGVPQDVMAFDPALVPLGDEDHWPRDFTKAGEAPWNHEPLETWQGHGDYRVVTVLGPNGSGKSTLARRLLEQCHEHPRYRPGLWVRAEMLGASKAGDGELYARAIAANALVVDELGRNMSKQGAPSEWMWGAVTCAVREVLGRGCPVIVTGNVTMKSISESDSALYDTLRAGPVIVIDRPSLRGRGRKGGA